MTTHSESIQLVLAQKKRRLVSEFLAGDAPDFQSQHARIIDAYFFEIFEKSTVGPRMAISKNPYAVLALGSYGRNEQSIFSDIDLLFLFQKNVTRGSEALIREMIYPLWDLGLEVGYATRSIKECLSMAAEDYEILTSLLDSRFVCGISPLLSDLKTQLHKKIIAKRSRKIIDWLIENGHRRHQRFGNSAYLLEPNLKEGQGGLRDYHVLQWIARIKHNITQTKDLLHYGYLSQGEFEDLFEALSFIWDVRNHLHVLSGRRCDQLHFDYQGKLAGALKFEPEGDLKPVEVFLGELHRRMELIKQQYLIFVYEIQQTGKRKRAGRPTKIKGLYVKKNTLNFVSAEQILQTPELLMRIFAESCRLNIPLSAESNRLIKEFSGLIDRRLKFSAPVRKVFEKILLSPATAFEGLNGMLTTGLLEHLIPEIKAIANRIQYDTYHIYPVARHSLKTVQEIHRLGTTPGDGEDPIYKLIYDEIKAKRLLLWAALLHDIGKGAVGGSHAIRGAKLVRRILTPWGLAENDIETVSFLVQEHLTLKEIATRRDINDEETAIFCARKTKNIQRLKMLYLLSVADAMATGPMAWNDWSAALLKNFFLKVLRILEKGELASRAAVKRTETKKKELVAAAETPRDRNMRTSLFSMMSPRYILDTHAGDIEKHIHLYQHLGKNEFVWRVSSSKNSDTRTVTICAQDRPGLFSKISGVFVLHNIDILSAQIYTWRNNIALDIFKVTPPPDRLFEEQRWARIRDDLNSALSGKLDLPAALAERSSSHKTLEPAVSGRPQRVVVDNESSSFFTIIEVFAYDFPGLLYAITQILFDLQLDIWVARIATKVDQVVDVFYVRDFDGQKVDLPQQVSAIESALEQLLLNGRKRLAAGAYH